VCSSGRQPNFAALNRGRRLCSEGRPSRWALAHILVAAYFALFRNKPEYLCVGLYDRCVFGLATVIIGETLACLLTVLLLDVPYLKISID